MILDEQINTLLNILFWIAPLILGGKMGKKENKTSLNLKAKFVYIFNNDFNFVYIKININKTSCDRF